MNPISNVCYISGQLEETRHTSFKNTYLSVFNKRFNLIQIVKTAVDEGKFIWTPHPPPDLNFSEEDSKFWPIYCVPSLWGKSQMYLMNLLHQLNIPSHYGKTPNFFLYWLLNKKIKLLNGNNMDPAENLLSGKSAVMNCADFIFLSLYMSKILTKEEICEKYMEEFKQYGNNFDFQRVSYYGLNYSDLISLDRSKPGDIVILFNSEKIPVHLFFKGYNDEACGLWNLDDDSVIKGDPFFPQLFLLDTFLKNSKQYYYLVYPLEKLGI